MRSSASQTSSAESQHCHFAFVAEPPVGGTFWFQIFIQAPSPEIWSETISGGEEVLAGKWGGLFWATSLEKIIGGVIAIISFRPGGWMQQSAAPRCVTFGRKHGRHWAMRRREFIALLGSAAAADGRVAVRVNRQRAGTGRPQ